MRFGEYLSQFFLKEEKFQINVVDKKGKKHFDSNDFFSGGGGISC